MSTQWIARVVAASTLTVLPVGVCGTAAADDSPSPDKNTAQSDSSGSDATPGPSVAAPDVSASVGVSTSVDVSATHTDVSAGVDVSATVVKPPPMSIGATTKPAAPTTVKPRSVSVTATATVKPHSGALAATATVTTPRHGTASVSVDATVAATPAGPPAALLPKPAAVTVTIPVFSLPPRLAELAPVHVTATVTATVTPPPTPPRVVTFLTNVVDSLRDFVAPATPHPVDSPLSWAMLALARRRDTEQSSFGRMFPGLPALNQQTNQQLADLAQTMLEPAAIANPKGTSGGVTFFGQFIDHDLTADPAAQPTATIDPTTLHNGRTFAFDLDSVYGGGPTVSPQLYDSTGRFLLGVAADGVSPDLPRNPDGSAILVEPRNDENEIISQIHVSFLRLHNELMDQGMSFDQAQATVINAYRYVVINDYLPQIVGQAAVDQALGTPLKKGFYNPGDKNAPMTPVEFSVAAFRFGHSQVRAAYNINDQSGGVQIFSANPAVPDLRGGRVLPAGRVIDFDNFFTELPADGGPVLIGRAIDTNISPGLFALPIPGAEASGSNVLAFRNMLRAKFYDMPSYEQVATAMGLPIVGTPVFPQGTPLWYGILREAQMTCGSDHHLCAAGEQGGGELGPVGGAIVAEVFVDVMRLSTTNGNAIVIKTPKLPDTSGGDFRIGDLMVAADALAAASV